MTEKTVSSRPNPMKLPAFLAALLLFTCAHAKPIPVIFDTDITGDVDDALALAMLHSLADRGHCEILAVTISKENELAAPFVDAINTFYGRPDIPIGVGENLPHRDSKYLSLVETKEGNQLRYPHDMGSGQEAEKAVPLILKTLEKAEDNSVAIIQVGLACNIADLLTAEGGKDLVKEKVHHLSVMAGAFETINGNNHFLEANVRNHIPSMQTLATEWPNAVPVIWSGFKIGISAPYPRESIAQDFEYFPHHPVKEAYLLHSGPNHDRPTWDLTSVLYSIFPDRDYFDFSSPGRVTVEDDGFTRFRPVPGTPWGSEKKSDNPESQRRDRYLLMDDAQAVRVQEALVQFVVQPPRHLADPSSTHQAAEGQREPVKLIFDTDMGNDVDDALALAMIHTLENRGACELLAITSTKDHPKSVRYLDAFNHFYGRPDIPLGAVRDGATPELGKFNGFADDFPHDLKSGKDAPGAVALLRQTLAGQPDRSVTIAQVGFFTNLAQLLESKPDAYSDLNGMDLVKKKVRELVVMAGAFQTIRYGNRYREYNVIKDIPSARALTEKWPTPMVWSGFEIGIAATYPWQSVMEDFETHADHILKKSYVAYVPAEGEDRPTWDLTAVLYAVYPDRDYFELSPRGTVRMHEDGMTFFNPPPRRQPVEKHNGRDRFLVMDEVQAARVREALTQIASEPAPQP